MVRRSYQVDSHPSHRVGGTASDFTFQIVLPPMTAEERKTLHVVVTDASIPKSFDNVPSGRNTFTLRENGGADVTVTIPVATYNALNFKTVLQQLLNVPRVGITYTVNFSTTTGRYTITCVGGNAVIVMPQAVGFGIHTIMGLDAGSTNALPITSTNKVNYQLTSAVQLRSDMVSANDNILTPVMATETEYASSIVQQFNNLDLRAKPMSDRNNGSYRFYITDVDGQPLDLNGGTVVFQLLIYNPPTQALAAEAPVLKVQEPDEKEVKALAQQLRAVVEAQKAAAAATQPTPAAAPDAPQEEPQPVATQAKPPDVTQAALAGKPVDFLEDPPEKAPEKVPDEKESDANVLAGGDDDLVMVPDHFE